MNTTEERGRPRLTILGGGIAGLAAGYFAKRRKLPFEIHEAAERPGGNCVTLRHGEFAFDSGAHRLHDRQAEATGTLKSLLGSRLREISVPSQIYHRGRYVDFPLSPLNLMTSLGPIALARVGLEVLQAGFENRGGDPGDFETFAVRKYGKTLASLFLLNYSEKLWGIPGLDLYQEASSNRLEGLTLGTFVKEAFFGKKAKTRHLDGSFYYPETGIGEIPEALAGFCGPESVRLGSRVTRVLHDGARIREITFDPGGTVPADKVISTIPVTELIRALDPAPPAEVLSAAGFLKFRQVRLVALFLKKECVTRNATVYFPSPDFPFTRIYEPSNRSRAMSPPGHTSIVAEIPCSDGDEILGAEDGDLARKFGAILAGIGWIRESEIVGSAAFRLPHAYPVLSIEADKRRGTVFGYLGKLDNLILMGRGARFRYLHMHNLIAEAGEIVRDLAHGARESGSRPVPEEVLP
jgi:protoporphyrinogen oxidase